ncbi:MAG: hypothetical protein AAF667_08155 [Pseudomonadota bacterium]
MADAGRAWRRVGAPAVGKAVTAKVVHRRHIRHKTVMILLTFSMFWLGKKFFFIVFKQLEMRLIFGHVNERVQFKHKILGKPSVSADLSTETLDMFLLAPGAVPVQPNAESNDAP